MKIQFNFSIVFNLLLLGNILQCSGSPLQYAELFSDWGCVNSTGRVVRDKSYFPLNNNTDTDKREPWSIRYSGLWKITSVNPGRGKETAWSYGRDSCYNPLMYLVQLYSLERFGPPSETEPEIYFYEKKRFEGSENKYNSSMGYDNFDPAKKFESFFFIGNNKWSVYSGVDKTGEFICLEPSPDVIKYGYGMTYNFSTSLIVGSFHYGCESSPSPNVAPHLLPNSCIFILILSAAYNIVVKML